MPPSLPRREREAAHPAKQEAREREREREHWSMAVGRSTHHLETNTRGRCLGVVRKKLGMHRACRQKRDGLHGEAKRGGNWARWLKPKPEKEVNGCWDRRANWQEPEKETNKLPR